MWRLVQKRKEPDPWQIGFSSRTVFSSPPRCSAMLVGDITDQCPVRRERFFRRRHCVWLPSGEGGKQRRSAVSSFAGRINPVPRYFSFSALLCASVLEVVDERSHPRAQSGILPRIEGGGACSRGMWPGWEGGCRLLTPAR